MYPNKNIAKIADGPSKFTHSSARDALTQAYKNLYHKDPSDGELDFGLATAFFETGYGRAGGQFAKWASEGKYNWGALQSGTPGPEKTFKSFKSAGLHPSKERGSDAGRPVYFYLFPNDIEAAEAFLLSWGRPDTLKAAASGSPVEVAKAMKNHNYYEGFWVPPGNPRNLKMPPFKEAGSKEEAERNNIRDYASALNGHVAIVTGKSARKMEPQQIASKPHSSSSGIEGFLNQINQFLSHLTSSQTTTASNNEQFLIVVGAEDLITKAEYARILQSVLQEELKVSSTIHQVNDDLEVSCQLSFEDKNQEVLMEVCAAVSDAFEYATGGYKTCTVILPNKFTKSAEMDLSISEINRRKFKLKIVKGNNVKR